MGKRRRASRFGIGPWRFELSWLTGSFRLGLDLATHDHALTVAICLWLFSLYVSLNNWRLQSALETLTKRSDQKYGHGREVQVYWFEDGLWWSIWSDPMESRSVDPWWAKVHVIRPLDILLGRPKYSRRVIDRVRAVVPMPEGGYPAMVELGEDSWKRPRWPRAKTLPRAQVTPDTPIPFPGKGENSWDCGEDASHSLYCTAATPLEAVMKMSESVMNSRLRYGGGWNYKPESCNPVAEP